MNILLLLCVLVLCSHVSTAYYFNYYAYAQQWPSAFCVDSGMTDSHSKLSGMEQTCDFAANITQWTIHGLWPSVNETYPNFCNDSWKLEELAFSNLEDDMRARWPSFSIPPDDFSFWNHEWTKHGTCATIIPSLLGPQRFFSKALLLNNQYNVMKLLQLRGITPREECYDYTEVKSVTDGLFQEAVILGCVWDAETKQQHLAQIEICFDKDFQLRCTPDMRKGAVPTNYLGGGMPRVETCHDDEPVCYRPIPHQSEPICHKNTK